MRRLKLFAFVFMATVLTMGLFFFFSTSNSDGLNKEIKLPPPQYKSEVSLEEAVSKRRSIRRYKDEPLTLDEVGQLLFSAQGKTSHWGGRAAPSAGALYPIELYLVVAKLKGVDAGIYHYHPESHSLSKITSGDKRVSLSKASLGQTPIQKAPINIVICAEYSRTMRKYGKRGLRYVHIEVGCVGENIYLQAETLGLGTVMIGAFNDDKVSEILGLKSQVPLCIMPVGRK